MALSSSESLRPWELDLFSFRELLQKLNADASRQKAISIQTATLCTYIYNYGGMRGKNFKMKDVQTLFPSLFEVKKDDFDSRWERASRQEATYLQQKGEA